MKSFKKMYESKRSFKICLFEGKEEFWPVVDGWTQKVTDSFPDEFSTEIYYYIDYFNDEKNFTVLFDIKKDTYFPNNFEGKWILNVWGKQEEGELKTEKNIKNILKKLEIRYEEIKQEAMKKIPNIPGWKKVVNDFEISYSRKQDERTVIVNVVNLGAFICNTWIGCKISVYNDEMNVRVTEQEFYEEGNRTSFRKIMSNLDNKFFKK